MTTIVTDIKINASITTVWEYLADIGNIYQWNPGVVTSHTTTPEKTGLGASRYCDLGNNNFLDEEVVTWRPQTQLTMRIKDTNLPFKTADIHFYLQPADEQTVVTVAPEYRLKFGLLGKLLDRFYVRDTYKKGMQALLAGLKKHIEAQAGQLNSSPPLSSRPTAIK